MGEEQVIAVTGGAGFIGSAVIRALMRDTTFSVVNIDALTYASNPEALADFDGSPRYSFAHEDICDAPAMRRVFSQHRPRAVLHLAAESHVDRSIDRPAPFVTTNVVGTATLLQVAHEFWRDLPAHESKEFRFHHVSTDEVYGSLGEDGYFNEHSFYQPNSPYAASKASADHLVRAWHRTYGLPVVTTNTSNNYGPYQFPEKLIPHMIISALEGNALPIYGDGGQTRDWIHVEDHVDALLAVLQRGQVGDVYAIGGRSERRNIEIVEAICANLDLLRPRTDGRSYQDQISHVADRPGHDRRYAIDPSKTERELGWQPTRTLETGLRETIQWYLDNGPWWQRIRNGAYRGERLGLG